MRSLSALLSGGYNPRWISEIKYMFLPAKVLIANCTIPEVLSEAAMG
jgi:hypothetical protein